MLGTSGTLRDFWSPAGGKGATRLPPPAGDGEAACKFSFQLLLPVVRHEEDVEEEEQDDALLPKLILSTWLKHSIRIVQKDYYCSFGTETPSHLT